MPLLFSKRHVALLELVHESKATFVALVAIARTRYPRGSGMASLRRANSESAADDDVVKGSAVGWEQRLTITQRICLFMTCWYVCSAFTLFGNKHIMSTMGCDPNVLAMSQMCCTAFFGAIKMYGGRMVGLSDGVHSVSSQSTNSFMCDMLAVGLMRFVTIMLGLVSLKFVAVSFTETVKSSAPFFTVIFARAYCSPRSVGPDCTHSE